jgi:hypothetical protein
MSYGPRIYSSTYKVFQNLLKEMDADFYDLFVKYNYPYYSLNVFCLLLIQNKIK